MSTFIGLTESAVDNLGAHLLGRNVSVHDPRNYPLSVFLSNDPLDLELAALLKSREGKATKDWAAAITARVEAAAPAPPAPDPTPTPTPAGPTSWLDADDPTLDQGQTPHCVGFTGADWENALPIDDHVGNPEGHSIYAACKVVDGEPGQQNGSTIHSLARVLKARGKLKTYAFASNINEVKTFVLNHGPICWGMGWTNSMFTPDQNGLVSPSGPDIGGHAIIEVSYDPATDLHELLNHWGPNWGIHGRFFMTSVALANRLAGGAEAMAAVEVAA